MTPGGPPTVVAANRAGCLAALDALERGAVVVVPTDTVYGLAARVDRLDALGALFRLKGRPDGRPLPVLVGRQRQVDALASAWPRVASALAARFWPGPLTLVVPAVAGVGARLGGDGQTVGIRRPGHRFVRTLCARAGPLAVTSANLHGQAPCTTLEEVLGTFDAEGRHGEETDAHRQTVSVVVDGGTCDGEPSTVVDCTGPTPTCLRQGAIEWAWVEAALR